MIACRASLILMSKRERDFSRALISRRRVLSNLLLICCFSQFDPFCKPHVLGSFNLKISPFNSTQGLVTWFSTSMRWENHNILRRLGSEQTDWTSSIVIAMIWKKIDFQFKFLNSDANFSKKNQRDVSWVELLDTFFELRILILFSLHQKSFQNRFKSPVPDYVIHFWCDHCSYWTLKC